MRCQLRGAVLIAGLAGTAGAQALTKADSALVGRILLAEDRRDSTAVAFGEGLAHPNARVRLLAVRGIGRVVDPKFALRDSLPALPAPPSYPDPAWRIRYRALTPRSACPLIGLALSDSAIPVRLHAADLVTSQCASDTAIVPRIWALTRKVPTSGARTKGTATWQPFAHALVALARIAPAEARDIIRTGITRTAPVGVRMYQARAAEVLADTVVLRRLADDMNDNVRELAIDGLARVSKGAASDVYIKALSSNGYQVVRAAANALKGAQRTPELASALQSALTRLQNNGAETARDARVAIVARLTEIGEPGASPNLATAPAPLPLSPDAVALALGREVKLRVVMADSSGGGSFIVRLRGDNAPIMAARVLELAKSGWYNNRPWYRVEHDFVIQGGGPGANEYVGHPRFMRDELGSVQHVRGTVGMSTRGHDTGDAQWFINLRDNQRLTPQYTLFGEVVDGIDVVDGILEGDVIARIEVVPSR